MSFRKRLEDFQGYYISLHDQGVKIDGFPTFFKDEQVAHNFIKLFKSAEVITLEIRDSPIDTRFEVRLVNDRYFDGHYGEYYQLVDGNFVHTETLDKKSKQHLYDNNLISVIFSNVSNA